MTAVILGGGFIGFHLSQSLSPRDVVVLGSKDCDLRDSSALSRSLDPLSHIDEVIITAAITRLRANDRAAMLQNIQMMDNILSYFEKRKPRHIVFFSTVDVYGLVDGSEPLTEQTSLDPDDHYALSKLVSEFALEKTSKSHSFTTTIFRLPGIYGKGDPVQSTICRMVQAAVKDRSIPIEGDGQALRDFVFVEDVCKIVDYALGNRVGGIFNIATGKSSSIREIAETVAAQLPFEVKLPTRGSQAPPSRAAGLVFDISALNAAFPEVKMTCLADGVRQYIKTSG
jgi:nucleoside-diphosphate-sugar epimerase